MPRLLSSTINFLILLIAVYLLTAFLVYKYSDIFLKTEKKEYVAKYLYFKERKDDYDTLFIGSSKIYRQIDAELFDSMAGTKSFNFGVNGLTPPANLKLLEKILRLKPAKLKTIIMELEFLRTVREYYRAEEIFYNFDPIIDIETLLYREPKFTQKDLNQVFAALFLKYTHLVQALMSKPKEINELYIGRSGYMPLDLELQLSTDAARKEHMMGRVTALDANSITNFGDLDKTKAKQLVNKKSLGIYNSYLYRTLEQCEKQNIKVIFLITPRSPMNRIYSHHQQFLETKHPKIINLNSIYKYPEFYKLENSFDTNHLNSKGAEIFTKVLADKYIKSALPI